MFVGHALLAFAAAVLFAEWRGWPTRQALVVGIVAGCFGALPDVDVLYVLFALDPSQVLGATSVDTEAFWGTANAVHRSITHSFVAAAIAGPAFGLWVWGRRERGIRAMGMQGLGVLALGGLVGASVVRSGMTGGLIMGAFVLAGLVIASLATEELDLDPLPVGLAATGAIALHPIGDLFTGEPPQLFYPFDADLVTGRVLLHPDPTLNLLGTFAIELGIVAFAAIVLARLVGYAPLALVDRRAGLGVLYGSTALVIVPPTLDVAYHFVFTILLVGLVCGLVRRHRSRRHPIERVRGAEAMLSTTFTGIAGIAFALGSYGIVYNVLG